MINYEVIPLNGQGQFDLTGVKFNGKSFMFWKKKSTQVIKEIMVIFDKKYESIEVRDGMIVLSLKGLVNYQELYNAIGIFLQIMKSNGINVQLRFVIGNDNERKMAEALGNNLRIQYGIQDVRENVQENMNENVKVVEDKLKSNEQNFTASGSKTIETESEKYTINNGIAYANNGTLSIEEEKALLLQKWQQDPFMSRRMNGLTAEEIDDLLTRTVTSNLKEYRMESAYEQVANDRVGEVAMDKARQEDGMVNAEIGIVQNNVSNINEYSAVEQRGENVQVVNISVTTSQINSGGVVGNVSGNNESQDYAESSLDENEEQQREVINEFYVDDEYNVYNAKGDVLGKIGQEGYMINYEDNILTKNGQVLGYISDYKDMGKNNSNIYSKPNVRTLKKKEEYKSAAFISLPVIMFILSALLLIGSVILLFVLD
ncbi:MAG: hypothetical protein IJ509_03990 [Bacilli bacterium]|nr:hypothetical protein [Bacilli bacterium]